MANSFVKAGIRLGKIHERNLKSHYAHLTSIEKRIVKSVESVRNAERSIGAADLLPNNDGWRKTDWGRKLLDSYMRAMTRYQRMRSKHGIDIEKADELLASTTTSRFVGGSF